MVNKSININKTVFVAMSGGVDSSVAAALLKKKGYNVVGVFMKNWSEAANSKNGIKENYCPWQKDQEDMRRVCEKLEIPFYTFDFEKEYKEKVVEYFYKSYEKGITPNPDIMCNKEIKFKAFIDKAVKLGAHYIATGHYSRVKIIKNNGKNEFALLKGVDNNKDQSYFLYTLGQKQLKRALFPIGGYIKPQIRLIAKKLGLITHNKKDSQGICFIGQVNMEEFLKRRIKEKPGKIITTEGKIIGRHRGLAFYTIGQRKGINIGGGIPFYVTAKNIKENKLIVGIGNQDENLYRNELIADNISWVSRKVKLSMKCKAKIRYRQNDQNVEVIPLKNGKVLVKFTEPQRAVTSGQSVVFYQNNRLLGGGIIE